MNGKKFLLIGLIVLGFGLASTPSQAGVSVGIGIGVPLAYPYPYPPYPYPYYGYGPVVYAGPSFYWWHGHRVFVTRHHRFHRVWW